jgi:osmoprotectant transport system substrate-binding protein
MRGALVRAPGPAALVASAGVILALVGCGSAPVADGRDGALGDQAITVASFDFPESELLAEIYGRALVIGGYEVRFKHRLGPREFVQPALAEGLVEFVPEYLGTALEFLSLGNRRPTADTDTVRAALGRVLDGGRVVALTPAPAQDANALVVTPQVAARYDLHKISDLKRVADSLTLGGPPECPTRPFCLEGLGRVYGLEFAHFLPLDAGGPLTHQALAGGHIDVALLFSTDPRIASDGLIVLADDRGLQPAENVIPLIRAEVAERWGVHLVRLVNAVSAALTTDQLRALNRRVAGGENPAAVADQWLTTHGLP